MHIESLEWKHLGPNTSAGLQGFFMVLAVLQSPQWFFGMTEVLRTLFRWGVTMVEVTVVPNSTSAVLSVVL